MVMTTNTARTRACPKSSDSEPLSQPLSAPLSRNGQSDKGFDKGCDKGHALAGFLGQAPTRTPSIRNQGLFLLALLLAASVCCRAAGPVPGPWTPIFKGVDHAVGTNNPSVPGNFPELQVVHCIRVDLTDPDIQLFATPRASS